jgi:predicted nucleic acid-binding protein
LNHVIDADVALALVIATPYSDQVQALWERCSNLQTVVFAPDLWAYEVTSALRKAMAVTGMQLSDAVSRLEVLTQWRTDDLYRCQHLRRRHPRGSRRWPDGSLSYCSDPPISLSPHLPLRRCPYSLLSPSPGPTRAARYLQFAATPQTAKHIRPADVPYPKFRTYFPKDIPNLPY